MTLLEYEQNRTIGILKRILRELIRRYEKGVLCHLKYGCGSCDVLIAEAKSAVANLPRPA